MEIFDKERRKKKSDFLEEHFEDPEQSDILVEKQVKEGKKKR